MAWTDLGSKGVKVALAFVVRDGARVRFDVRGAVKVVFEVAGVVEGTTGRLVASMVATGSVGADIEVEASSKSSFKSTITSSLVVDEGKVDLDMSSC
jgi:hypothetical protein